MPELLNVLLPLILILSYFTIGVLYCLSQQAALRSVKARNRQLAPGLVWLQLIPMIGILCNIVMVILISDSFQKEFDSHRDDSVLGIDADTIEHMGKRPTLGLGITYFVLFLFFYLYVLLISDNIPTFQGYVIKYLLGLLLFLTATLFFILYWVKLVRTKRKIAGLSR